MENEDVSRRNFIGTVATATIAATLLGELPVYAGGKKLHDNLAVLGGTPLRPPGKIGPPWPYVDEQVVESVIKTTRSRVWSRIQSATGTVATFEKKFAELIGAGYCVGTGSGTQALSTSVEALGIGPGDEVITSPYTDMGTISSILTSRALPVMVDLDPDTYQLDPAEIEKKITSSTKAIMPVHIFGLPADMERIMSIAAKHKLKVIEDACQAPLARYQGKGLGTIGDLGCFSFQASKSIACGEGGAVVGNDAALMDKCFTIHNRGANRAGSNETIGPKYRMNEFEGAVLLGQLPGVKDRFRLRNENAAYLTSRLNGFAGLVPQKKYPGTESGGYYQFAMTYNRQHFNGADRSQFLKAVNAEGVTMGSYIKTGLHREPWVAHIAGLKEYKNFYPASRLQEYQQGIHLPKCDRISDETMVAFEGSSSLLGTLEEMDTIINAIMKVYDNREQLRKV